MEKSTWKFEINGLIYTFTPDDNRQKLYDLRIDVLDNFPKNTKILICKSFDRYTNINNVVINQKNSEKIIYIDKISLGAKLGEVTIQNFAIFPNISIVKERINKKTNIKLNLISPKNDNTVSINGNIKGPISLTLKGFKFDQFKSINCQSLTVKNCDQTKIETLDTKKLIVIDTPILMLTNLKNKNISISKKNSDIVIGDMIYKN